MKYIKHIKNLLKYFVKQPHCQSTFYSHYGEDMILHYIFQKQTTGFYVDVGSYHPEFFSNTKKLYDKGWSGINIDANIDSIKHFNSYRPNDINLNFAIAEKEGIGKFFKFRGIDPLGGGSGNSLSLDIKKAYEKQGLKAQTSNIQMKTLASILGEYAVNKNIDFLNIDVEGFDFQVLKSNNWDLFRPQVIAVEIWHKDIDYDHVIEHEIYKYLRTKNYRAFSNTIHTWFFYDIASNLSKAIV